MNKNSQVAHDWEITTLTTEDKAFQVFAELRGQKWLCRGQSKCYGGLTPSIDLGTLQGLSRIEKIMLERQSINLFRSTVKCFSDPGEQKAQSSDIIALMVLRHYNVPTRLLDWSRSPYVAAYFAVCCDDTDDGEIWSFDHDLYAHEGSKQWSKWPETTIDGSGDPSKFDLSTAFSVQEPSNWFVCQFYTGFPRQNAQEGAYSLTARFDRDHADAIARLLRKRDHYHLYVISAELKPVLRRTLREKHGIWRGSLYPDVAGAAETAHTVFKRVKIKGAALENMKNLENTKRLLLIVDREVDGLEFEANDRNRIAGALFDIVHEHAKAIVVLLENRFYASAFALARPIFEGFVRGAWLRHCAKDNEVESVIAKDEFKLNFGTMLKVVEDRREWPDTLTQVKKSVWSGLHSYTHGGMLQISRRIKEDTIESKVDEKEIDEFVRLISLIIYLSLAEMIEMCKTKEKDQMLNDLMEWVSGWCFNN